MQNANFSRILCRAFLLLSCAFFFSYCDSDDTDDIIIDDEVRIRKNAKDMTAQEMADYTEAILLLKNTPSPYSDTLSYYDQFVRFHQMAVERKMCTNIGVAHTNPAFPPWHRKLLILYEDALREVSGKDIALPYWDWTDMESTNATFSPQLMGGSGDPADEYAVSDGPFRKGAWEIHLKTIIPNYQGMNDYNWLVRNFGATTAEYPGYEVKLPDPEDIQTCLDITVYDEAPWDCTGDGNTSFRFCLEGFTDGTCGGQQAMHNIGHDWIAGFFEVPVDTIKMIPTSAYIPYCDSTFNGMAPNNVRIGSMEPLDVSPNDPAFFMHHCNVDRIWALWQQIPGNEDKYEPVSGQDYGYNLNDDMYPYDVFRSIPQMDAHGIRPASMLRIEELGYEYN